MLPERRAWSAPIQPLNVERISRRYVPNRTNLGFIDPATAMSAAEVGGSIFSKIGDIFGGLFGKDPDKTEFDTKRQQIWNQFANMVDTVDALSAQNQLDYNTLLNYSNALQTLMQNFTEYYNRMRAAAGAAWTDPRYHDFFDPMQAKYNDWVFLLSQMSGEVATPTIDPRTGEVTYSIPRYGLPQLPPVLHAGVTSLADNWPLIGLGVAALYMFSRSTRRSN